MTRTVAYIYTCDSQQGCTNTETFTGNTEGEALNAAWRGNWHLAGDGRWACPECLRKIRGHPYKKAINSDISKASMSADSETG